MLVGWLVVLRHHLDTGDQVFYIPDQVKLELEAAGLVTFTPEGERTTMAITDAGTAASDLAAPEWGIDPLVEAGEADE